MGRKKERIETAKDILKLGSSEIGWLRNGHGEVMVNVSVLRDWARGVLKDRPKFLAKVDQKEQEQRQAVIDLTFR